LKAFPLPYDGANMENVAIYALADLIKMRDAKALIVAKSTFGMINHLLMTVGGTLFHKLNLKIENPEL
jgi:dethiobiotin synthetase